MNYNQEQDIEFCAARIEYAVIMKDVSPISSEDCNKIARLILSDSMAAAVIKGVPDLIAALKLQVYIYRELLKSRL